MPSIEFKKGRISYDVSGKGSAIVFLHGFLEDRKMWNAYSEKLSRTFRTISIDLPGHGESSIFGYCHSMELMSEAVMAVLKHLKIRRFYLIGHSMGGYVSMSIAEFHPDNIKGLCMFHSTADCDGVQKKKDRDKVIKVIQKNKEIFIRESIPNLFNTKLKPYKRAISTISKMARSMNERSIIAALEGMKIRSNREIILKFAPYPILYIIGKEDNILPYKKLIDESLSCERSEYLLLDNAGHMGFIEESQTCLKAIKKFLKKGDI